MMKIGRLSALVTSALAVGISAGAAVGSGGGGAAAPQQGQVAPAPADPSPGTGRGESLVLVVSGSYPSQADAMSAASNISVGDVQGMYVIPSDGLEVLGVYEQTNATFKSSPCTTEQPKYAEACAAGGFARIREQQQPLLRRLDGRRWQSELGNRRASGGRCAADDAPPCVTDRFDQLLGTDGQFDPGRWLVTSGFRTKRGAELFLSSVYTAGVEDAVVIRVKKNDDSDVGLGQEPHPNGNGPLVGRLADPDNHQ